jgi:hypothetical protein
VRDFVRACEGGAGECHFPPLRLQLEQAARDAASDSDAGAVAAAAAAIAVADKRGASGGGGGESKASGDGKQRNGSHAAEDKPAASPAAVFRCRAGDLLATRHSNLLSAHLALHVFCGGSGGGRKLTEGGGGESKDGVAESEDLSKVCELLLLHTCCALPLPFNAANLSLVHDRCAANPVPC